MEKLREREDQKYYETMRRHKVNQERVLGEESYFKPEDISRRSRHELGREAKRALSSESEDPYRGQMYESRMAASRTYDDIENAKFRVRKKSIESLRRDGVSVVE